MDFEEILEAYLKKLSIQKPVTFEEFEAIFLISRKDFFEYQISLDQFSSICEYLHIAMGKNIKLLTSHLETVLGLGMELSWYVRQRPKNNKDYLLDFLQGIHDYKQESKA